MIYPELETLKLERRGPVGWLLNNRPDQLNAMNARMRDEFEIAWRALDADPDVRVIVHTGEGRAFQTGVDVNEIATDGEGMGRYRESVERFDLHFTAWQNEVWKPVITAVNGICAGGGFHWIADADIVIAASDAQFFDPHVSIGQVVSIEAIGLMKRMPVEAVMRMAFVGRHERMPAQRAYELGMVSEVVDPPERLRDAAQELAEKIAELPGRDGRDQAGALGRARARPHRRVPGRSPGAHLDVGPSRPGGRPARVRGEARPQLAAARTRGRLMVDVAIGTAIVAYIEPHAGEEQAFNRWYERDHMYAATTAGPGAFSGARWVATRACKARRPRARRGSASPRGVRSSPRCGCSRAISSSGTSGSRARWRVCAPKAIGCSPAATTCTPPCTDAWAKRSRVVSPAATALDHPCGGVAAIAVPIGARHRPRGRWPVPDVPTVAVFTTERVILADTSPPPHDLVLGFTPGDPLAVWTAGVEPVLATVARRRICQPLRSYHSRHRRVHRRAVTGR